MELWHTEVPEANEDSISVMRHIKNPGIGQSYELETESPLNSYSNSHWLLHISLPKVVVDDDNNNFSRRLPSVLRISP